MPTRSRVRAKTSDVPEACFNMSFVIRLSHLFLPIPFRCPMVLEHFFLLPRIVELDLVHAFMHPIEKEPGRSFADPTRCRTHLDVEGTRRGKTECAGHVGDCSYQKPATRLELDRAQGARPLPVCVRNRAQHVSILNDLQRRDGVTRIQCRIHAQIERLSRRRLEGETWKLAIRAAAQ